VIQPTTMVAAISSQFTTMRQAADSHTHCAAGIDYRPRRKFPQRDSRWYAVSSKKASVTRSLWLVARPDCRVCARHHKSAVRPQPAAQLA
jgi:hypothetical protein